MGAESGNRFGSMSFDKGVTYMKYLWANNTDGRQRSFSVLPNLEVCYPGVKNPGDYILLVSGKALRHSVVCVIVASYVLNGTLDDHEMLELLEEVYEEGCQHKETDPPQIWFLKCILYWTTLQEEINYPQSRGRNEGRRMSFKRYAEAVLATRADSSVTLDDVMCRADDWKKGRELLDFPGAPPFYY